MGVTAPTSRTALMTSHALWLCALHSTVCWWLLLMLLMRRVLLRWWLGRIVGLLSIILWRRLLLPIGPSLSTNWVLSSKCLYGR